MNTGADEKAGEFVLIKTLPCSWVPGSGLRPAPE